VPILLSHFTQKRRPAAEAVHVHTADRWFAVGRSAGVDPYGVGADAASAALTGTDAKHLVVFCGADHDPAAVLAGINATSGGVPLIGCSSAGEIGTDGPGEASVVVAAFGGTGFEAATACAAGAAADPRQAGAVAAASAAAVEDSPHLAMILLTDGLTPDQEAILRGAYDTVGAGVPLVGGSASPGSSVRATFQLHGDQVLTDAVVTATLGSSAPLGIGVGHGWRKVGEPMIVTSSEKGRVCTLDDEPALERYLGRLGAPAEVYTDPTAFDLFTRTRPLGIRRRVGEEVRNVSSTEYLTQGWLGCSGDIAEGGLVWVMEGDERSVLDAAEDACRAAVDALEGTDPIGFLAFDCASRSGLLGESGMTEEVDRMNTQTGGLPLAGFYTWGEIARTRGINGYHHQTLVVLAVS